MYVGLGQRLTKYPLQAVAIAVCISTACDSSCLMGCIESPGDCCNYYNNSMCVEECPSSFQPNTANECCPPGTTGHNCTDGESNISAVMIKLYMRV